MFNGASAFNQDLSGWCVENLDASNTFSRIVGEGNGSTFTMNFKIENLKVLDGNYAVAVSSKGISHFKNKDIDLEYFIALEPDSSYSA